VAHGGTRRSSDRARQLLAGAKATTVPATRSAPAEDATTVNLALLACDHSAHAQVKARAEACWFVD
jgi:hypothetical protein